MWGSTLLAKSLMTSGHFGPTCIASGLNTGEANRGAMHSHCDCLNELMGPRRKAD